MQRTAKALAFGPLAFGEMEMLVFPDISLTAKPIAMAESEVPLL